MADATQTCGLAISENSAGAHAWSSPENVYANDNNYASCSLPPDGESEYLWCTDFDFASAGIPSGATIDGIAVLVKRRCSLGACVDVEAKLLRAGAIDGDDRSDPSQWSTVGAENAEYGGASDDWGTPFPWTVAAIEDADFGFALRTVENAASPDYAIAEVDYVTITVTYSAGGSGDGEPHVTRSVSAAARRLTRVGLSQAFAMATLVEHVAATVEHFPQAICSRAARNVASRPTSRVFAPVEGVAPIAIVSQYDPPVVVAVRRATPQRLGRSQAYSPWLTAAAGTCDCQPVGAVLVGGVGYAAELVGVRGDGMVFPYRAELVDTGVNLAAELVSECDC